jgi:hypothetical protein
MLTFIGLVKETPGAGQGTRTYWAPASSSESDESSKKETGEFLAGVRALDGEGTGVLKARDGGLTIILGKFLLPATDACLLILLRSCRAPCPGELEVAREGDSKSILVPLAGCDDDEKEGERRLRSVGYSEDERATSNKYKVKLGRDAVNKW